MPRAYIGIGSNLDAPRRQVASAIEALQQLPHSCWVGASPLYRSQPVGPPDQPDYVNAAAAVDTGLAPEALLDELQAIEQRHGRTRAGRRWGARVLDLDVLLYGDERIDSERLQVPHPELPRRGFALQPLFDLDPGLVVPGAGELRALLQQVSTADLERLTDDV